jgi:hypothetical protein
MPVRESERDTDDKKRCVFAAPYKKIGVRNWIRSGSPYIELSLDRGLEDLRERYKDPQVELVNGNPQKAVVRVFDDKAIDLSKDTLLGDYWEAAERCDEALLQRFSGDYLTKGSLNEW